MKKLLSISLCLLCLYSFAQENLTYQKPSKEILDLVDVPLAPSVQIDSKSEHMVLLYRDAYKSIAELSEAEMRLAGLRINPVINIGSRTTFYNNFKVKKANEKEARQVEGLPNNPRLSGFRWSPDETMIACLNTTDTGVEVWVLDVVNGRVKQLTDAVVNANMGSAINWFKNGNQLLIKTLPANRPDLIDTDNAIPQGPTISVSDGSKAQNRTSRFT
ncbi:MAG: hypothetical protein HKP45_00070 [Winogradskyella sp.]|nr:hypothetical protein [Winogradskyella sp.]